MHEQSHGFLVSTNSIEIDQVGAMSTPERSNTDPHNKDCQRIDTYSVIDVMC